MKLIFNVVTVLVIVLLAGCVSDQLMVGSGNNITTVVTPKPVNAKDIDIIKDLDCIILEAKENAFFGYVSKLRIYRDKIYVLDDRHANALFIYTMEGKHVATIGDKVGRGPQEFVQLSNFEIDYANHQILTMDNFGHKFMIYDLEGNFIKQVNSDIMVSQAALLPNGNIFHAIAPYLTHIDNENRRIIVVDENKKIVHKKFEYKINKNLRFSNDDIIRSQLDGSFNFAPLFRDTIYAIVSSDESLQIIPKYAIDFGDNRHISQKMLNRLRSTDELKELAREGFTCFFGDHVETEDFLYLRTGFLPKQYVFFNKHTNSTIAIYTETRMGQYEHELYNIFCSDDDGYFYGALNLSRNLSDFFKLLPVKPEIDLSEEINPILFRYKVKI